jgi:uncharacterized membrane protein YeaQ/YmgE (transglycosylase-associated protein family)
LKTDTKRIQSSPLGFCRRSQPRLRGFMFILWSVLFGALVGWVGSLVMRTVTNEGILIDIAAGMLGAIPMAALLGNNAALDSIVAGGLGALIAVTLLNLVRSRLRPS